MATYPVINKTTGEQKEVVVSIDEWDQWKIDNPDCREIGLILLLALLLKRWESGKTNFVRSALVGMMSLVRHKQHLVQQ